MIERLNKLGNWEEVDRVPGNITEWEERVIFLAFLIDTFSSYPTSSTIELI